jgi:hypothetical protein
MKVLLLTIELTGSRSIAQLIVNSISDRILDRDHIIDKT